MIENNFQVEQEFDKKELSDVITAKFRSLAKQYFQFNVLKETDNLNLVKESSLFYGFRLPESIGELFIKYEEAPLFWVYNSPVMQHLENLFNTSVTRAGSESYYKIIKEFYTKWLLNKHENEKRYFAASALKYVEKKSNKNNFLNLIYQSVILGYDRYLANPSKAVELLEISMELINGQKLNDDIKEKLKYLILLYQGFYCIKQNNNKSALNYFTEALSVNSSGITAKFYQTLNSVIEKDEFISPEILNDLYSYDILRIEFAIDNNNLAMMKYFIKYALISNLFFYPELSNSYPVFFDFLRDIINSTEYDINKLKANLNNLKNLNMQEYYDNKIESNILFIEELVRNYYKEDNVLFVGIAYKLYEKFKQTVEAITSGIKNKFYGEAEEKLKVFENELQYKLSELQILTKEHEEQKIKFKEKMDNTLKAFEKKAAEHIAYLEERIENLNLQKGYDPRSAFKNAMTYNIMLSFTVFLMSGCAEYSNTFISETARYYDFFSTVVLTGFKWGIIAFSVGLIISLAAALVAVTEGSNQKKKLLKTINKIKDDKDYQIEYYRKESEIREKESDEKFNKTLEVRKKYIDSLKAEKETEEKKYKEEADKNINRECKPLLALIE